MAMLQFQEILANGLLASRDGRESRPSHDILCLTAPYVETHRGEQATSTTQEEQRKEISIF